MNTTEGVLEGEVPCTGNGDLVGPLSLAGWGRPGCKTCHQGSGDGVGENMRRDTRR